MEQMGNGVYVQWGNGLQGYGVQGVWGTWAMRPTGGMGHRGMGHMGNRVQGKGYRVHGQWDIVMEYIGIIMLDLDLDVKI